jgi:hypothetical protein
MEAGGDTPSRPSVRIECGSVMLRTLEVASPSSVD